MNFCFGRSLLDPVDKENSPLYLDRRALCAGAHHIHHVSSRVKVSQHCDHRSDIVENVTLWHNGRKYLGDISRWKIQEHTVS